MLNKSDYEVIGNDLQAVIIRLSEAKSVFADPGSLVYTSDNVKMDVTLGERGFAKRILSGFKRTIVGENFFLTRFSSDLGTGEVVFSSPVPGKIIPVEIPKEGLICEKQAYLCSDSSINIEVAFAKRIGAGLFGREGFILQKLTGEGTVFVQSCGTIIKKTLGQGEIIKLDPGCVVAFDPSVDYDIKYVGNIKTAIFGGVGLFFVTLVGPGNVYIQTLPLSKLSRKLLSGSKFPKAKSNG
ncbi:MAG: TIGR00266 family protein [Candidatus Melainabacteria bacterium RIFOXYA12_FULL_32_12]|nr:MAG: TIGR00266 family protein [Candidatus Melainabacteria bacterium RIFOXYA2_FULL_32_9]OGI26864.1 MAG: TIGR00266 family protein [Candidatus Melainabacteria bacterium RIFOXYA12_FULL_32_12]